MEAMKDLLSKVTTMLSNKITKKSKEAVLSGANLEEPLLVILQLLGLPLGPPLLDVGGLLTHHQVCMRIILVVVRL